MAVGDIAVTARGEMGGRSFVVGTVIPTEAAWPAGGYAFTPTLLGLASIENCFFEPLEVTATTFVQPVYVRSIGKVTIFEGLTADAFIESNETTASASGGLIRFIAWGVKA